MAGNTQDLAILFADITGSVHLYETLGDLGAKEIVNRVIQILQEEVIRFKGTPLRTLGDEVMASFREIGPAFEASEAMHQRVALIGPPQTGMPPVAIHVGIHWGQVIDDGANLFGDAVNVAARMRSLAKAGQTLTTGQTTDALGPWPGLNTRHITHTMVKGRYKQLDVHEVVWQVEGLTQAIQAPLSHLSGGEIELILKAGQTEMRVGSTKPVISIGRGEQNDLVVPLDCVSRVHARIEFRRGKFILVDQSTNGTYVFSPVHNDVYLHLDELSLEGYGLIGLGRRPDPDSEEKVYFAIRSRGDKA
jgi:class 3 adenylate cyclase